MWTRQQSLVLGAVALGCTALGSAASYLILSKRLEVKYATLAQNEIEEAKEFYSRLHKTGKYATPELAVEALSEEDDKLMADAIEAVKTYDPRPPILGEPSTINIFSKQDSQSLWDQEREEALRDAVTPYVISKEEFFENEPDHVQLSFTYWEGDGTLADEQEEHVPDLSIVGEDNLIKFGYGSDDDNVVYIRNEAKNLDIEISRSNGKYAYEVLGLEHSDYGTKRGIRKFRNDME